MKITEVRALQPFSLQAPNDWRGTFGQILVIIETDTELTGFGIGGGGSSAVYVVNTLLRDLLLGRDPADIATHWRRMYRATLPFGRKGLAVMALSGVDLALWDLKAKAEKVPVAKLLSNGEPIRETIPTYVTVPEEVTPQLASMFDRFKLRIRPEHPPETEQDEAVAASIEQVRQQIQQARSEAGQNCGLMLDGEMQWTLDETLALLKALRSDSVELQWLEEPLPCDLLDEYTQLCEQAATPIGGGEHEYTAAGFQVLIAHKAHDILQPDVTWCGGMTELVRIYELAREAGLKLCPHRGAELWGLHALAALDPDPLAESPRGWISWVGGQPPIMNGQIQLPDRPGFGAQIELDSLRTMP